MSAGLQSHGTALSYTSGLCFKGHRDNPKAKAVKLKRFRYTETTSDAQFLKPQVLQGLNLLDFCL